MHFSAPTLLAAAALIPSSMAHYCFNKLIVDGNYTGEYEYVRKNNNSNSPVTDVTSTDLRCNSGGLLTGNVTSTYTVAAGASVGFGLDTGIGHPGPLQVYMSKAPDSSSAAAYDGSGEWFKVYEMGPAEITSAGLQWASNEIQNFTFTLPEETPAGQYLLRAESIALHGAETVGGAQFYISCAQIEVTSSSTSTPAPTVDIPGVYTGEEPGILINIYYPIPTNYTMPGPAVWPSDGTSSNTTTTASNSTTIAVSSAAAVSTSAAVSSVAVSSVAVSSVAVSSVAVSSVAVSSVAVSSVAVSSVAAVSSSVAVTTQAAVVTSSSATPYYPVSANSTIAGPTGFTTSTRPLSTGSSSSGTASKYGQCGGSNWTGATECESGSTCTVQNDFYSQCV